MKETRQQRADRETRERIQLSLESLRQAQTPKDLALWVTHDGMSAFNNNLLSSLKGVVKEAVTEVLQEFLVGLAEGQLKLMDDLLDKKALPEPAPKEQQIHAVEQSQEGKIEEVPPVDKNVLVRRPWDTEQDMVVARHMTGAATAQEGMRNAADELGRTPSQVRSRWYSNVLPTLKELGTVGTDNYVLDKDDDLFQ